MICTLVSPEAGITRFTVSQSFGTPWRTCLRWVRLSDGRIVCLGGYNTPVITAKVSCPVISVTMGGSYPKEAAFLITEAPRISGSVEQPDQSYQVVGYDRRGNRFGSPPRKGTLIVRANCVRFNINP